MARLDLIYGMLKEYENRGFRAEVRTGNITLFIEHGETPPYFCHKRWEFKNSMVLDFGTGLKLRYFEKNGMLAEAFDDLGDIQTLTLYANDEIEQAESFFMGVIDRFAGKDNTDVVIHAGCVESFTQNPFDGKDEIKAFFLGLFRINTYNIF